MPPTIALKRAYDPAEPTDGCRILVERLWPRGLTKDRAAVDVWMREAAPTTDLRRWFDHQSERWPEFQRRYAEELRTRPEAVEAVVEIRQQLAIGPVTFVFASRETHMNNAVALRTHLLAVE